MHRAGLVGLPGPAKRACTNYPSSGVFTTARIWSSRTVAANKPGQKWVGDITYIPTWEGFTYLATVMDCYPR